MRSIILIILIFISINITSQEGDFSISLNGGVSSGIGFGLGYEFNDFARIKVTALYGEADSEAITMFGGSLSLDIAKLNDQISSFYFFIGNSSIKANENLLYVVGLGFGFRKFINFNMFWEIELGLGLYKDGSRERQAGVTGNFNLGYSF